MIDKIVREKPVTVMQLKKIISAGSAYYCGEDLIKMVLKYI